MLARIESIILVRDGNNTRELKPAILQTAVRRLTVDSEDSIGFPFGTEIIGGSSFTQVTIPMSRGVLYVMDLCHEIKTYDVSGGRVFLSLREGEIMNYFPDGDREVFGSYKRVFRITHQPESEREN